MKNKPEWLIVLLAVLATAAKLYCAATTIGTVDIRLFYEFGQDISREGSIAIYQEVPYYNHPPLLGNYLGLAFDWSHGGIQLFSFFIRLPGILADLGVIGLLLVLRRQTGRPPWWALAVLTVSPVSFMISGYHGNFDPLIPLGLVLTVAACQFRQPLLAGVLLGLACQVKIIPLMMSPILFFFWLHRGRAVTFTVATVATLLVGWSALLLAAPGVFVKQVLVYNSIWGWWGFTYLLNVSGWPGVAGMVSIKPLSPTQALIVQSFKIIIITGTLLLAWRRRKGGAEDLLASMGLAWTLFFTFAPGFGVQYLAWISPFLLFVSARWLAAFTATASIALFIFYNTLSGGAMPWRFAVGLARLFHIWGPWLLLPWAVIVAHLAVSWREFCPCLRPSNSEPATPEEPASKAETALA